MELLCEESCTKHEIIVEKEDETFLNSLVDSYELGTVEYSYDNDEILITLKQVN
tara:strand:- start:395 stop:556 length:162 start_codon:yes stop_codon:yes gene_type:complete